MLFRSEKDMEIIRSKRAANPATIPADAPKGKYRKRSVSLHSIAIHFNTSLTNLHFSICGVDKQRASPPGKCHSCNIRETPEWRRGPDGARTLCNACGLRM